VTALKITVLHRLSCFDEGKGGGRVMVGYVPHCIGNCIAASGCNYSHV
jgi:hypothetical protein